MQLTLPRVVFGSSALGNLYEAPSRERKLAIARQWLACGEQPTVIDTAGKYGAGLALETIGVALRELNAAPDEVLISNKLGWLRTPLETSEPTFEPGAWVGIQHDAKQHISRQGIIECWEQGLELLGDPYRPQLVSVHDPDEFLAGATDDADKRRRTEDLFGAYEALLDLKQRGEVRAVGVGSKDWRVAN
ncbi:MAG: aldo/keto reductase, partial [Planctomycetales bacterium]|nr:aldo/keto reductase [Planctomycetales bacterium]